MERILKVTGDGSHSIYLPALNEHYHSYHGALNESRHVFIDMGLRAAAAHKSQLRILEVGFGTGLNALLTADAAMAVDLQVAYIGLEAHPLSMEEVEQLNYATQIGGATTLANWEGIHQAPWDMPTQLHPAFQLHKVTIALQEYQLADPVDLIYFDAFAPEKQPEMWHQEIFERMHAWLAPGGLLVTYCAKGVVRRTMIAAGLRVERTPGPPGKREMLRAWKD